MSLQKNLNQFIENTINSYISLVSNKYNIDRNELQTLWSCGSVEFPVEKTLTSIDMKDTSPERLTKSTVPELKALCKTKGLKCSGKKEELVQRLLDSDKKVEKVEKTETKVEKVEKAETKKPIKTSEKIAKPAIIKQIASNVPIIAIRKNAFGRHEHAQTGFVFENETVIGKQKEDGTIEDLTDEDIEQCKQFKFKYNIPSNLDRNNTLDKVKVDGIEDEEEIIEDIEDSDVVEEDETEEEIIEDD